MENPNKPKKYFTFLCANSDYDPKLSEDPNYQFAPLPSALDDLEAMRDGLTPTVFNLESNPPKVAKNYSKDDFNNLWTAWCMKIGKA